MFLHADSEDSDPTGRMPSPDLSLRWVQRSFCWFCHSAAHLPSGPSMLINWTSPFPILGVSGVLFLFLLYFE